MPVLTKLKKILAPGLKNSTSSSSSSSSSSRSSSSSSSRVTSKAIDAAASGTRLGSSSSSSRSRGRLSSSRSVNKSSRTSSASSLASLFSASSSSSRSSARLSKVNTWRLFCDFVWKNVNVSTYHSKCGIWQKYFLSTASDLSSQVPEGPQEAGTFNGALNNDIVQFEYVLTYVATLSWWPLTSVHHFLKTMKSQAAVSWSRSSASSFEAINRQVNLGHLK